MLKKIFSLLLALTLTLALFSCGVEDDGQAEPKSVEDMTLPNYKAGQTVTLSVYNWGEYIADDTNDAFEEYFNSTLSEKYGGIKIKVEYSTYATNEDMYSKLKNSAVSYDVVIPSDYMIEKMKAEGMLLSFDTSTLSNYPNIPDSFRGAYYDPDDSYSVPYTYGMMGIIYNTEAVDEADLGSWGLLWNEKYSGNILQFNNPRDAFATAMYRKGLDVNSPDPEVWDEALEYLKEQKPLLQAYVNDEIFNKMESESATIAPYFVGDFLTMNSVQENLDFYYPEEGVNYFVDAMCIPTCSSNPHLAKEYINFMISEETAVENALAIGYASPNTAVMENEDYKATLLEDYTYLSADGENAYDLLYSHTLDSVNANYNALFPDTLDPACYRNFDADIQTRVNTLWEELKIWGSTELWVHVATIVIVAAVLSFAIYSAYIKRKRAQHYRKRK